MVRLRYSDTPIPRASDRYLDDATMPLVVLSSALLLVIHDIDTPPMQPATGHCLMSQSQSTSDCEMQYSVVRVSKLEFLFFPDVPMMKDYHTKR